MPEYRVTWCQSPHIQHPTRVLFIEAASPEDAKKIARDHVERTVGIEWFSIFTADETIAVPAGQIKYLKEI